MSKKIKIVMGFLVFSIVLMLFMQIQPAFAKNNAPSDMISPVHHFTELSDFWVSGDIDEEGWVSPRYDNYIYVEYGDCKQHTNQTIVYDTEDIFNTFSSNESSKTGNISYSGEKLVVEYSEGWELQYENDSLIITEGFNNTGASWENVTVDSNASISLNSSGHYKGGYTWINDSIGGNPSGWDVQETQGTIDVIAEHLGHKNVLKFTKTGIAASLKLNQSIPSVSVGTLEYYVSWDSFGIYTGYPKMTDFSGDTSVYVWSTSVDKIAYYNGSEQFTYFANGTQAVRQTGVWYRFKITFNCTSDTWNWLIATESEPDYQYLYDSGNSSTLSFQNAISEMGDMEFYCYNTNGEVMYIDSVDASWYNGYYENRISELIDLDGYYISNVTDFGENVEIFNITVNSTIPTNTTCDIYISDNSTGGFTNWMNYSNYLGNSTQFLKYKLLANNTNAIDIPEFFDITFNFTKTDNVTTYLNSTASWESLPVQLMDTDYPCNFDGYSYNISSFMQYNDSVNANMTFNYSFSHNITGSWSSWLSLSQIENVNFTFFKIQINVTIEEAESNSVVNSVVFQYNVLQTHSYRYLDGYYDENGLVTEQYYKGYANVFHMDLGSGTGETLILNETNMQDSILHEYNGNWELGFNFRFDDKTFGNLYVALVDYRIYISEGSNNITVSSNFYHHATYGLSLKIYIYQSGILIDYDEVTNFDYESWYNYRLKINTSISTTLSYECFINEVSTLNNSKTITPTDMIVENRDWFRYSYGDMVKISVVGYDESIDNEYYSYRNTEIDASGFDEVHSYLTLFKESKYACNVIAMQQRFDKDFLGNMSGYNQDFSETFIQVRLENGSNQESLILKTRLEELGISSLIGISIELYYAESFIEIGDYLFQESFSIPKSQSEDILFSFVMGFWKINEYMNASLGCSYQLKNSTHVFKEDNVDNLEVRSTDVTSINLQMIDGMVFQLNTTQYNVSGAVIQNGTIDASAVRASEVYRYSDDDRNMYFSYEYIINSPEFFCDKLFLNRFDEIGVLPPPEYADDDGNELPLDTGIYLPLPVWFPFFDPTPLPLFFRVPEVIMWQYAVIFGEVNVGGNYNALTFRFTSSWYFMFDPYREAIGGHWGFFDFFRIAINFTLNVLTLIVNAGLFAWSLAIIWIGFVFYVIFICFYLNCILYGLSFSLLFIAGWTIYGILLLTANVGLILASIVSFFVWVFSGFSINYFVILQIVYSGILNFILFMLSLVVYTFIHIAYFGISIVVYLSLIMFLGIKRIIPQNEEVSRKAFDLETLWRILTAPLRYVWGALIKIKDFIANWG